MNIIDELEWRGAVNQQTDEEGLRKLVEEKRFRYTAELIRLVIVCILDI